MESTFAAWRHLFKLDPDKPIGDEALDRLCLSGTDAIVVGGSTGATFDNVVDLLGRVRRYVLPCALEVSDAAAIVPGFDLYFIPFVLNARDPAWLVRPHVEAVKQFGPLIDWDETAVEGYIVLNPAATVARLTDSDAAIGAEDAVAYARTAENVFRCPIVYLEYSGMFGDMALVARVKKALRRARLFYGGGIASREQALAAAAVADTIVVGNIVYADLEQALATVVR